MQIVGLGKCFLLSLLNISLVKQEETLFYPTETAINPGDYRVLFQPYWMIHFLPFLVVCPAYNCKVKLKFFFRAFELIRVTGGQ